MTLAVFKPQISSVMKVKWVLCIIFSGILVLLSFILTLGLVFNRKSDAYEVRFGPKLKIVVAGSTSETVKYEIVLLPNRTEVYGRLKLRLPSVLSTSTTPAFYLRSAVHEITYRGVTRNQTWNSGSLGHIFPKKAHQNHVTVVDRFDPSKLNPGGIEKLHTKTKMLISSSPNGTFQNLFLYKSFTIILNIEKIEEAFKAIEKMPIYDQKQGPLSVLEEDILYDDFTM